MGGFDHDSSDTVVGAAPLSGELRTRRVNQPLLGVIHKGFARRNPGADHCLGHHDTVDVETFQPVVVVDINFAGVFVVDPDGFSPAKQGQQGEGVRISAVDRPLGVDKRNKFN